MKKYEKIAIVSGGTGGHVFPAQAFGAFLRSQNITVQQITDARGARLSGWPKIDEKDAPEIIQAAPPSLNNPKKMLCFLWKTTCGCVASFRLLGKFRPDAVIGFGGYVAFPLLLMALFRGVPIWLHEQNVIMGKVNKFFSRWAKGLGWALPPLSNPKNYPIVGMPLRTGISDIPRPKMYHPPLAEGYCRLLILGGSQGARALSTDIPRALQKLPLSVRKKLQIHHQVRQEDRAETMALYHAADLSPTLAPFFENVGNLLAETHLVISRAGASAIAEIQYFGKPAIFVPYPFSAGGHQAYNCQKLLEQGMAWKIDEGEKFQESLALTLKDLYSNVQGLINAAERMTATAPVAPEKALLSFMTDKTTKEKS